MKIYFVAEAENVHTRKWVQYFVEKGHEILVLSHEKVPIPGVQVFPGLRVTSRNWLIRKFEVLRNTWTFWPIVRAFDPDILMSITFPQNCVVLGGEKSVCLLMGFRCS